MVSERLLLDHAAHFTSQPLACRAHIVTGVGGVAMRMSGTLSDQMLLAGCAQFALCTPTCTFGPVKTQLAAYCHLSWLLVGVGRTHVKSS